MERLTKVPILNWVLRHRRLLGALIIILSFVFLTYYLANHPESLQRIAETPPSALLALFVLYSFVIGTNVAITYATVRLCKHELPMKNSALLTVYSTIINFFGPLQSGPGVRAVYLKTKLGLRIRDYTYAMLFYFAIFGFINVSLLFVNTDPLLTLLGLVAGTSLVMYGVKKFRFSHRSKFVFMIYVATVVQILLVAIIDFVELQVVDPSTTFIQAVVYGSSANLSLFVSITPGAIGIREAFIVFAQSLHNLSFATVIAAGVLDRAFYIVFLVILFAASTGLHVKESLFRKKP